LGRVSGDLRTEFDGPGRVWYQTRGIDSFTEAILESIPGADDEDGAPNMDFI